MNLISKLSKYQVIFTSLFVTFFVFLIFLPFGFLDFDGGHDAYMTIGALALSEGVAPFTGVNLQYGFATSYLQSLVVNFSSQPTLNLRILDSSLLAVTAGISFFAIQNTKKLPKISTESTLLALFTWLTTSYFLVGIPQLPWSTTFILLVSMLIATINFKLASIEKDNSVYAWLVLLGLTVGLAPFLRVNAGLALIGFEIIFVLLISRRLNLKWKTIVAFFASLATGFLAIPIYLTEKGFFFEFIQQSVLIPRRYMYSPAVMGVEGWNTFVTTRNYFLKSLPFIVLFLLLKFLIRKYSSKFADLGRILMLSAYGLILLTTALTFVISSVQPMEQYSRILVLLYVSVLISSVAHTLAFIVREFSEVKSNSNSDWQRFVLSGISIALLTQTFPTNGPRHIWWSSLPGLLVLASYTIDDLKLKELKRIFVTCISLVLLASLAIPLTSNLRQERKTIDFPTISLGMAVTEKEYIEMKSDFELLEQRLGPGKLAYFDCGVGETHWYAAFDKHYRSQDLWFVNLSFYPGHPIPKWIKRMEDSDIVVVCGDREVQQIRQKELQLDLVESGDRLGVYTFKKP